jgi:MFS transporter, MHS family, proline/betaine transporter
VKIATICTVIDRPGSDPLATHARTTGRTTRHAVAAVALGNVVEWYDFAIYGAFATVLGATFFPVGDRTTQLLLAFAVYGTALLVRPLGAWVFGPFGDRRGRRAAMIIVIVLMALATAGVGLLPGYAAIGVVAPVVLMMLRAAQGLGAGGEIGVSSVFMFEQAPEHRRGTVASWQIATLALGIALGMTVGAALSSVSDGAALRSGWWRLAFVLALPLGLVGWYVRSHVDETSQFLALPGTQRLTAQPWRALRKRPRGRLWRGFAVMAAGSLAFNTFFIFLPNHVVASGGAGLASTLLTSASALVVAAAAAAVCGRVSDRVGRRPVVAVSAIILALVAVPVFDLAARSQVDLWLAQCIIGIATGGVLSVAMLAEAFPTELRSTGVAMTAGLATALVGGTAPFVEQIMIKVLPIDSAPGIYVAVVAGLALIAVWRWEGAQDG